MTEPPPLVHNIPSTTSASQNTLSAYREQIDALDAQLLKLLNQRALVVEQIGKLKKKERLPVYSPAREEQLLRRLTEQNQGPLSVEAIRAIYREILSASRAIEKEIIIACLGSMEDPTYHAAHSQFGSSAKYAFYKGAADVFKQIAENKVDYGVLPLEQKELKGDALNDFIKTDLHVCGKITPPHCNKEGTSFLVIGRTFTLPSGFDCTLIALRVEDMPNALANALELLKKSSSSPRHFSHLATWAILKESKDLFFLMEVEGHFNQLQASGFLRKLSQHCRAVKVLGSYPSSG